MSEFDSWFLGLAVESPISFQVIIPYDQCIVPDDYQTPSNLTTSQMVNILFRLFQNDFLLAITPADLDLLDNHLIDRLLTKAFIPSCKQIKSALDRENFSEEKRQGEYFEKDLYFFLTKKGGETWESLSKPNWDKYFRRCILNWESVSENTQNNATPPNGSIICCANKKTGEKVIAIEHLLEYSQFIPQYIKNSAIWEKFAPWHPTYWKTLPYGCAVSYQSELVEIDENYYETEESTEEKKQAREWYKNITNWYINPRI